MSGALPILDAAVAGKLATLPTPPAGRVDLPPWAGGQGFVPAPGTAGTSSPSTALPILDSAIAGHPVSSGTQPQGSTWQGDLEAIPAGLYAGVAAVPNLPTSLANLGIRGINALTGSAIPQFRPPINTNPTDFQSHGEAERALYSGAAAVGSLPAMAAGGEVLGAAPGLVGQIGRGIADTAAPRAVLPAAAAGVGGQIGADQAPAPWAPLAAAGGAVAAGLPVAAAEGGLAALRGSPISPETAALARTARGDYNIPVTGGQISNSPFVRFLNSTLQRLPFTGYAGQSEGQQAAFNRAVASTFGEDAESITPDVMSRARNRLGSTFDMVAARTSIPVVGPLLNDLGNIEFEATRTLQPAELTPLRSQLEDILTLAAKNNGVLDGPAYQSLTRHGAPLGRLLRSTDPNTAFFGRQIRDALDNALEQNAPPEELETLQNARAQWKNMITVAPLAAKATTGDISPGALLGQVNRTYRDFAYGGGGALGDLARIGRRFLAEPPSSGTAERLTAIKGLKGIGELGAGALAGHAVVGEGMAAPLAGAASMLAAARAAGMALRSDWFAQAVIKSGLRSAGRAAAPGALSQFGRSALGGAAAGTVGSSLGQALEPSRNPETGDQEFSFRAAQEKAAEARQSLANIAEAARNDPWETSRARQKVANFIADAISPMAGGNGKLADPDALRSWIDTNKPPLRQLFGGQGLQRIMAVGALARRAARQDEKRTALAELMDRWDRYFGKPKSPIGAAFRAAGIGSPRDLLAAAVLRKPLAEALGSAASPTGLPLRTVTRVAKAANAEDEDDG